jgi:hypothetical protein
VVIAALCSTRNPTLHETNPALSLSKGGWKAPQLAAWFDKLTTAELAILEGTQMGVACAGGGVLR